MQKNRDAYIMIQLRFQSAFIIAQKGRLVEERIVIYYIKRTKFHPRTKNRSYFMGIVISFFRPKPINTPGITNSIGKKTGPNNNPNSLTLVE